MPGEVTPEERFALLVEAAGGPFDAGKGRPMREWVAVVDGDDRTWLSLAREALDFVGSRSRR